MKGAGNLEPPPDGGGKVEGLVAAAHTPFDGNGRLALEVVEQQAAFLRAQNVATIFIGGTTGESHCLTTDERLRLAERWAPVAQNARLKLIIHVGANCLADARALAAQAARLGAAAISALSPSYFKPGSVDALIACCAEIASAAPETPFYFYDIPSLTGVNLSMPEFLERAPARIATLAGLKFTNPDLVSYQLCLAAGNRRFDVPWGVDECLLAALSVGARGAVGSTYNVAAPIYHRLIAAFERGDWESARLEQMRSVRLVRALCTRGYMASAKALMGMLGVPVGPPRLPHLPLIESDVAALRRDLTDLGFFEWIKPASGS